MTTPLYREAMREYMRNYMSKQSPEKIAQIKQAQKQKYIDDPNRRRMYYEKHLEKIGGREEYNRRAREYRQRKKEASAGIPADTTHEAHE